MAISNSVESSLLNAVLRGTNYTAPTTVYVKLHTADPGGACTTAPAGNTTRQAITFAAPTGTQPTTVASSADVTWTNVSTAETYAYISLWDSSSAGTALWSGPLTASKTVAVGDNFTLTSGQVTVSLT